MGQDTNILLPESYIQKFLKPAQNASAAGLKLNLEVACNILGFDSAAFSPIYSKRCISRFVWNQLIKNARHTMFVTGSTARLLRIAEICDRVHRRNHDGSRKGADDEASAESRAPRRKRMKATWFARKARLLNAKVTILVKLFWAPPRGGTGFSN